MAIQQHIPGASIKWREPPLPPGPGRLRKVGILGGHQPSLRLAPWADPTWEWWVHASISRHIQVRPSRLFDIHPPHVFNTKRKNGFADYPEFLQRSRIPVYMQNVYKDIPMSRRYPREAVKSLWPGVPVGSTTAWMIALALLEGVTHLGCWGITYSHETEYARQRANAERWVGVAQGAGVHLVLPENTPFCRQPEEDYGYESHDTPEKYQALRDAVAEAAKQDTPVGTFDPSRLVPVGTIDARAIRREKNPGWAEAEAEEAFDQPVPQRILDREAEASNGDGTPRV